MATRTVQAVFFWRYIKTPFRAAYGRLSGTLYSKDFLQSPSEQWPVIDRVLGRGSGERIAIEYRWPGGTRSGQWRQSAADSRGQLAWETSNAPRPWKVGDPSADLAISIPGDSSASDEVAAEAELSRLEALALDPWILAVKLHGEDRVLHARACLGNPPAGLEHRSVERLPSVLRDAIRRLPANTGGGAFEMPTGPKLRAPALVRRIVETLQREQNVLLVGPPGTGKTVALEDLRALFTANAGEITFDPMVWDGAWSEVAIPSSSEKKVVSLVFHPSYSYEDFVAGLVPQTDGGVLSLVARPGPLLSLAHWAGQPNRMALLTIDEFNRGPAAAIFGDTLALLDGEKRDTPGSGTRGAAIERPFPRAVMEVGPGYAAVGNNVTVAELLRIPKSLWIVAALNSTDRSVAPIDAALRRRFAIIQVPPDYDALALHLGTTVPNWESALAPSQSNEALWTAEDVRQLTLRVMHSLNERIGVVLGQDFLLGHALLWSVTGDTTELAARSLAREFDERIAASLRLTFVDQDEALGAILRVGPMPTGSAITLPWGSAVARWINPPADLQTVATPRVEVRELAGLSWEAALRCLQGLL